MTPEEQIAELEKILERLAQFDDRGAAKERASIERRIEQLREGETK